MLKTIGKMKSKSQLVIGFAAETNNLLVNAKKKLLSKNANYIIANDVSKGIFGSDENKVTILSRSGNLQFYPRMSKKALATAILQSLVD